MSTIVSDQVNKYGTQNFGILVIQLFLFRLFMKWWKRRSSNEEDDGKQSELRHRWQYDYTMRKQF